MTEPSTDERVQVTTAEELDALPVGSVVEDAYAAVCTKVRESRMFAWARVTTAVKSDAHHHSPYLPATVLYRPEETT